MRKKIAAVVLPVAMMLCSAFTHASGQSPTPGPTFDVVSIKRNLTPLGPQSNPTEIQRPDGGFTTTNVPVSTLIIRAYPATSPLAGPLVGLPDWVRQERYDISATSSLPRATAEDRIAMLRAMLADRFKLVVHVEKREQPVYNLVLARSDGRLGSGLKPSDLDCVQIAAERAAAAEAARNSGIAQSTAPVDLTALPPACTLRTIGASIRDLRGDRQGRLGDLLEGEGTMDQIASALLFSVDRRIVNKTGLTGSYRVTMNFDMFSGRGLARASTTPEGTPSVFTALQEQLGLKLVPSRLELDSLVIDRLERPTEN